jgi:alkanesulfonate monooxygenase SsuD/methylene tetrahydromethanopterin reductase-like flavin-dependent oxidoreductase (luciferase family)
MENAVAVYRHRFQPSAQLAAPHVMLAVNVFAAETEREARRQASSQQQAFVNLIRGKPGQVPAPIDDIEAYWAPHEKALVESKLAHTIVGTKEQVAEGLTRFIAATGADELMISGHGFDPDARVRSLEIISALR